MVMGRHDIEAELALEFRDHLLRGAPAANERVEGRRRQAHVGGHRLAGPDDVAVRIVKVLAEAVATRAHRR
jgi:hypothetical protein